MIKFLLAFISKYPYQPTGEMIMFRVVLYSILLTSLIFLMYSFLLRTKQEEQNNGMKNPLLNYYLQSFVGILLISMNVFVSSISLLFSGGKTIMFGAQKAILYNLGTMILIIGLVNLSFNIIYFNSTLRTILNLLYRAALIMAVLGQILVITEALGGFQEISGISLIKVLAIAGALYLLILISSTVGIIQQLKYNASPIERTRILLIAVTIILQIIQLIARVLTLIFANNPNLFNTFSFFVYPIIDFIGYPISFIFLTWSIYTPLWLQIKAQVIPKQYISVI